MKELLDKVGIINFKYEKLKTKDQFNIISLLIKPHDEVNLHSKLICNILDPQEKHNLDLLPLESFLSIIGVKDFKFQDCCVQKEHQNIDILISNKTQAIIIENKIWARDQEKQIERYYELIKNEGYQDIWIYYLTLNGREPSTQSKGNIDQKVEPISYEFHINQWIEKCIELASRQPALRESLVQYQNVIKELTGNHMAAEQINEIIELLSQNDNMIKASAIAENWNNIKSQTELRFWLDLEKELAKKYVILPDEKYSSDIIHDAYFKKNSRNLLYGIVSEIARIDNIQVCLSIERGEGPSYFGLVLIENETYLDESASIFSNFADEVKGIFSFGPEGDGDSWICGNFFKPEIDFEIFSEKETLQLLNEEKRKIRIQECLKELEAFISKCEEKITELNIV